MEFYFLLVKEKNNMKYYICIVDCDIFSLLSIRLVLDGLLFLLILENLNDKIFLFKFFRLKNYLI